MTSPEEKKKIKARNNLKFLSNGVINTWSQGHLKTWKDVYVKLGFTSTEFFANKDKPVTFPEIKAYLKKMSDDLERKLNEPTQISNPPTTEIKTGDRPNNEVSEPKVEVIHEEQTKEVEGFNSSNDYGLHPSPYEKANHFWFQKKAIKELYDKVVREKKTGILLLSGTGTGKTYIIAGLLRRLIDADWHIDKTWSPANYLYLTKTTILEQTERVYKKLYNLEPVTDVEIINLEQMRSKYGKLWVREVTTIVEGEEVSKWKWNKKMHPPLILLDESQGAKNPGSTQSQIIYSYNDIPDNACLVCISATPFTRVSEAKAFAVSTHRPLDHLGFPSGTVLTNDTWPTYAAQIAHPSAPEEYSQAAIERLMKDLEPWIVRVRGVKPQFGSRNGVKIIPFENEEKRKFYETAWERFLKEKAKLEAQQVGGGGGVASGNYMFVILLKQRMAAEFCHAEGFADSMYRDVMNGKAACCAVAFKATIIEIVRILNEKYGVKRDEISLVWGGGQTQLTEKQKAKKRLKELAGKFEDMGMTAEEAIATMGLEEVEDREMLNLPEHLRLGPQDLRDRQIEIDKFQSGKSLYCLYTFKAGGVGLSLHHTDELTNHWNTEAPGYNEWITGILDYNSKLPDDKKLKPGKARRKESGYVVEEDIPFILTRPRTNKIALTYNAIEMVQGVGRPARLTSLSETVQDVIAYEGTIEEDVGRIVSQKLRCLSSVVRMKEDWQSIITHGDKPYMKTKIMSDIAATTENEVEDENNLTSEGEE